MNCDDIIDSAALARLRRLGGDRLVGRMIDLFSGTGAARVEQALQAAGSGDLHTVERATHSLKSSAGNVGARELQELAGRIEELAGAGDGEAVRALLDRMKTAHEEATVCLTLENRSQSA